ncbi:MAG: penicillin-binding protein activator [Syntrophaceae bacterium]|nr:penicillin-binding protein activator [Syntrophaceae bacterium]
MKNYRIFSRIIILLLLIFIASCAKPAVVVKEPGAVPSEDVVTPPEAERPFFAPKVDRFAIGCVLPLSGPYSELGGKALDAILLSAEMFDERNKSLWKVIARDSRGLPDDTKAAIEHLANTDNVIAIIAVSGAAEALDAAREAERLQVPLILITSREGVTLASEYVFQHFLTPTQQVRAVVNYALNNLNSAIFSALYPDDDYGEEMVEIFREEVARVGGRLEKAIPYAKNKTDFTDEINRLTGNQVAMARAKAAKKTEPKKKIFIDFEALFIPDSYRRVQMISAQLAFYDVRNINLLGTSLWNSPHLLTRGAEYLEGAVFADSFFPHTFYRETNDFTDIYYTAYSRDPENIEALAYDTAAIIFDIIEKKDIQTRQQLAASLTGMENYPGVTGTTSFGHDRVSQKTPFILKVKNGKLEQVR